MTFVPVIRAGEERGAASYAEQQATPALHTARVLLVKQQTMLANALRFARAAFDVTEADWDEIMAVNLRGVFFMSQAVARTMVAAGRGGRIVNISSQGGLVGLPDAAVYCTSKGGVNMMTKTLALGWAKDAITVNAIAPTFIYTPGTAPILDEPATRAALLGKILLGQFALTDDVAGAIIYLASDAGRMVTGTVLVVDGGWTSQ